MQISAMDDQRADATDLGDEDLIEVDDCEPPLGKTLSEEDLRRRVWLARSQVLGRKIAPLEDLFF